MMACWKLTSGPTVKGEDVRKAFEQRLDHRTPDVVAAPVQSDSGPRIRLIA